MSDIMDTEGVAAYCGVGTSTIDRWRATEGLPFARIGGVVRFTKPTVDAWMAARVGAQPASSAAAEIDAAPRRKRRQRGAA